MAGFVFMPRRRTRELRSDTGLLLLFWVQEFVEQGAALLKARNFAVVIELHPRLVLLGEASWIG